MTTLLQLNTSLFSHHGQSTQLVTQFVNELRAEQPALEVLVRDFAATPVPHLTADRFQAFNTPEAERTPAQRDVVAFSDALIGELQRADIVVLGLPLYNFGIPSMLHAYFDHIARARVTFRYTEAGPEGLLKGKRAYVFAARGGKYAGTPHDTTTEYVRSFLRFVGIEDVQFVYAEGLAISEAEKSSALASARSEVSHRVKAELVRSREARAA